MECSVPRQEEDGEGGRPVEEHLTNVLEITFLKIK